MKTSEKFGELVKALAKAQGEFGKAVFDKVNPHFKSQYASLDSVHDAIKEPMAKHGLAISHLLTYGDNQLVMKTTLFHISGEWMACEMPIPGDKLTPQQLGSILSYYRRYSICCLLAIPSGEDDDGEEVERPKSAPAWGNGNGKPKEEPKSYIPLDEAAALDEAVEDQPDLKKRILAAYKAKGFDGIEARHLAVIWKGIKRDLAKDNLEDVL